MNKRGLVKITDALEDCKAMASSMERDSCVATAIEDEVCFKTGTVGQAEIQCLEEPYCASDRLAALRGPV